MVDPYCDIAVSSSMIVHMQADGGDGADGSDVVFSENGDICSAVESIKAFFDDIKSGDVVGVEKAAVEMPDSYCVDNSEIEGESSGDRDVDVVRSGNKAINQEVVNQKKSTGRISVWCGVIAVAIMIIVAAFYNSKKKHLQKGPYDEFEKRDSQTYDELEPVDDNVISNNECSFSMPSTCSKSLFSGTVDWGTGDIDLNIDNE